MSFFSQGAPSPFFEGNQLFPNSLLLKKELRAPTNVFSQRWGPARNSSVKCTLPFSFVGRRGGDILILFYVPLAYYEPSPRQSYFPPLTPPIRRRRSSLRLKEQKINAPSFPSPSWPSDRTQPPIFPVLFSSDQWKLSRVALKWLSAVDYAISLFPFFRWQNPPTFSPPDLSLPDWSFPANVRG